MNHVFPYSRFESHLHRLYRFFLFKPYLKKFGKDAFISPYAILQNMEYVSVGSKCYIGRGTLIQPITQYLSEKFNPTLTFEENVYIGNRCTISGAAEITIGKSATIGDHVFIGGGRHGFDDPGKGVLDQSLVVSSIRIGSGAWIGYGSFIGGKNVLEIGEHAIVAANSVVTTSVPAFTMVAGAPAKPIKYYDFGRERWQRIESAQVG